MLTRVSASIPFKPVETVDPERFAEAHGTLCNVFGMDSLYAHQEQVGQNILQGITTILDVPTGGGKTLAFWVALFYFWHPGNTEVGCQKTILVVGPLTAPPPSCTLVQISFNAPLVLLG